MTDRIILCGFMGCGKSTIGRLLAQRLGFSFVDTDEYIEQQANRSVAELFAQEGEAGFRRRETDACRALAACPRLVVAAGGGTLLAPQNLALLRPGSCIVYLYISPETAVLRLRDDTQRPLLQVPDREAVIRRLLAARDPLYRAAADRVVNAEGSPAETVTALLQLFCEK